MKTSFSATAFLRDTHQVAASPGKKVTCPFCGHDTLSVKRDDSIAKCFHPRCGRAITGSHENTGHAHPVHAVLEQLQEDCRSELMRMRDDGANDNAYAYCVSERKILPQVVRDSPLGAIPKDYDIVALFRPHVAEAEKALAVAEAGRKRNEGAACSERLDELREAQEKLLTCVSGAAGWLCFFYTDATHGGVAVRFRKPFTKQMRYFKPFDTAGVFGHGLFSPTLRDGTGIPDDRLIVVEGEFNQLQLQSLCAREAESRDLAPEVGYVYSCAVGGVHNADVETLTRLSQRPLVVYDNDSGGAGYGLVERLLELTTLRAVTTPAGDSDVDSYIRGFGTDTAAAHEAVRQLIAASELLPRPFGVVKEEVDEIRRQEGRKNGLRQFEAYRRVSEIVVADLSDRGRYYHDGQETYFFRDSDKKLLTVDPDNRELELLLARYGVVRSDRLFVHVVDAMRLHATESGTRSTVYAYAHYDRETGVHYLSDFDRGMIRTPPDGNQEVVDNGTDGVLFLHSDSWEPYSIDVPIGEHSAFHEVITGSILFGSDNLTVGEQRVLYLVWFLSLLFPELLPTRPIVAMIGERGSGKTVALRKIGHLLFGPSFNVMPLSGEPKDFDAAITNDHFVAIDNADTHTPWLNDRLAIASTGATIKRRRYYTNNELVEFRVRAFIGITSRTPRFTREDVADRLLIFQVKRFEGNFLPEASLLAELSRRRDEIMSEVAAHLREIVPDLYAQKDHSFETPLRMADFADFALKFANGSGLLPWMESILERLTEEQTSFALEDDPIVQLLNIWMEVNDGENIGREVTTGTLREEFVVIADSHEIDSRFLRNTRSFGQRLTNIKGTLRERYDMKERRGAGNARLISFRPAAGGSSHEADANEEDYRADAWDSQ